MATFKLSMAQERINNFAATKNLKTLTDIKGYWLLEIDEENNEYVTATFLRFKLTGKRKDYSKTTRKILNEFYPSWEFEYHEEYLPITQFDSIIVSLDSDEFGDAVNEAIRYLNSIDVRGI